MKRFWPILCFTLLLGMASDLRAAPIPQIAIRPLAAAPVSQNALHVGQVSSADVFLTAAFSCLLLATLLGLVPLAATLTYRKSLASDGASAWDHPDYFRELPNALGFLAERHFRSVWPAHCTPWSESFFRRRLVKSILPLFGKRTEPFVIRHMSVWRWLEFHRSVLAGANAQHCNRYDDQSTGDNKEAAGMRLPTRMRRQFQKIKRLEPLFREHGFELPAGFQSEQPVETEVPAAVENPAPRPRTP